MRKARRIVVLQPVLPGYRIDFFKRLAQSLGTGFRVYASPAGNTLDAVHAERFEWYRQLGKMRRIVPGLMWQPGSLSFHIARGDLVVIAGAPRCVTNLLVLLKARARGATVVWWGHLWSASSKKWRYFLRRILMRASHVLLFYTDEEVRHYRSITRVGQQKPAFALSNGVDTEAIAAVRTPYDPRARDNAIFYVGRLTEKSRFSLLLEAIAHGNIDKLRLDVIGSGPLEIALRKYAETLGVSQRVIWHGNVTDEKKIAEIANKCLLFVYPGAVGLSLIHAMAYGLPAIVHDCRSKHMPEIAAFEAGVTGRQFSIGDVENLAATIVSAMRSRRQLASWSTNAKSRVDQNFNTRVMAERFLEMLFEIENCSGRLTDVGGSS